MIREKAFVIAASRPWDELYCNDVRNMAEEIAPVNKILYINPPADNPVTNDVTVDTLLPIVKDYSAKCVITHPKTNIWVLEPPISAFSSEGTDSEEYDILNEGKSIQYAEIVKWAALQLDIALEKAYLLLDNDLTLSLSLAGHLKTKLSIYYRNDKPAPGASGVQKTAMLEAEIARRSDMVVTNDIREASKLRQYNLNTYNIGKGVDLSAYHIEKTYTRPADIADIETKIIGCAGTISSLYVSPSIIYRIALEFPDATIVMMGKKDPLVANHPVHHLPNVRFLGVKSHEELPAYIAAFDVCIDPAINKHPNSRYRNAIINYLALGKSVICTNMPHTQQFCDYVMTADTEMEFVEKVSWALNTRLPWSIRFKRAEFARTFSWAKCVERLYVVIYMIESGRGTADSENESPEHRLC